jgi:ribosomal protein S18 acetylase RimI-like enzyme
VHSIERLGEADFPYFSALLDDWWGGRNMRAMLPRLWFKDFGDTSFVARDETGRPVGFLVGFASPSQAGRAYVHFIGVDPETRKSGVGKSLYRHFFELCANRGLDYVEAVTHPNNSVSLAFHEAMGFSALASNGGIEQPTQAQGFDDYDGEGEPRVVMRRLVDH